MEKWKPTKFGVSSSSFALGIGLLLLGLYLLPGLIQNSMPIQAVIGSFGYDKSSPDKLEQKRAGEAPETGTTSKKPNPEASKHIQKLIEDIQEATAEAEAAAGPRALVFTDAEETAWNKRYPCRSRVELPLMFARRKYATNVPRNTAWEQVLKAYAKLHRTCVRQIGDLSTFFDQHNTSSGCKYVLGAAGTGLGNKLLITASTILYAVLTQRVIIVPQLMNIPSIFCEPFLGSSWALEKTETGHPVEWSRWTTPGAFLNWVDVREKGNYSEPDIYAAIVTDGWDPINRFFCDTEQAYLSKIVWLATGGCIYWLPKLFAVPRYRPTLEAIFPDRMALTHVLRTTLLPDDSVWERIVYIDELYLQNRDMQLGIQLRFFGGYDQFQKDNDFINARVVHCALNNSLLPQINADSKEVSDPSIHSNLHSGSPMKITKVFIASLFGGLHDHLSQTYIRHKTVDGEGVGIFQLTHENVQRSGIEEDSEALVEMMCLSFSDALFVTGKSTFGGIAQAYGGLKPWFINLEKKDGIPCVRGQSIDVCFQFAPRGWDCPYDHSVRGKNIVQTLPDLKNCLPLDVDGIQLITTTESDDF